MKPESFPATISICFLTLILGIFFIAPTAAQNLNLKPTKGDSLLAATDSNPRIKAGDIKGNPANALASSKDADYWFDKGALCATYGNDRAAVKYFQKVIALDPSRSGAYFEQGIAYGQLGDFAKAMPLLNKAIEMEPQNGLYLYGRGRALLLSGKQDRAMEDFNKAAQYNDEDAQLYLEHADRLKKMASNQPRKTKNER